ncbi:MAG TPA: ABC transporter permease subunit [Candidatus Sulfotelmatobacter sp.]|jgi:NitT/TauT family transport system permease protein|nr:ABC transporter permease subunit [Candidatus Sulfotelmatobacter sp.]
MNREIHAISGEKDISENVTKHKYKIRIRHHHFHFFYETTVKRHLTTIIAANIAFIIITSLILHFINPNNSFNINQVSTQVIVTATINTFVRLVVSYIFSVIVSIPLALLIVSTPRVQRVLLPISDVLQSIPVLAFFPVVIVFFTSSHMFEFAAIFIIFMAMVWNIVFTVIGGLQTIPEDVESAAVVFNVTGIKKFWYITLPAIFPFIVTGSLLAWAQGWTTVIVAEVLHTYIPNGNISQDLLGLGSLLVDSSAQGKNAVFLTTLSVMILFITLINFFVWQRLLHLAQRFKFD